MVDSADMVPEYDPGSMSGSTMDSIQAELRSDQPSFWSTLGSKLYSQRGDLMQAAGTYTTGQGYSSYFQSMANKLGLQAGSAGTIADWSNVGMIFPELQQKVIDIQTAMQRRDTAEKWLGRISATKARFAASGIAVDAGADTPMKAMLTLLDSSREELGWIKTNKQIREFNEVFMPQIALGVRASTATYQKELMTIQSDLALTNAKISAGSATTKAFIQGVGSVANAAAGAYGATATK